MSRVGKKPISIPSGVECKVNGSRVEVKGPKGQLVRDMHPNMKIELKDNAVTVSRPTDGRLDRSLHGLTRTLINNMVLGVSTGYSKQLNIVGVGYKVALKGKDLDLNLLNSKLCIITLILPFKPTGLPKVPIWNNCFFFH